MTTLAVSVLVGVGGCRSPSPQAPPFQNLLMEEGGFCEPGSGSGCTRSTRVDEGGTLELERESDTMSAQLSVSELRSVAAIVQCASFSSAIHAKSPVCPPTADIEIIFELEIAGDTSRDGQAAGCTSDEYRNHPYHALRALLHQLTAVHFPGVPPY